MSSSRRPDAAARAVLVLLATLGAALTPARLRAQSAADSAAVEQVRQTVRRYDDAVRHADAAALDSLWADEFVFVNPRGERLTKAQRLTNFRTARTTMDTLAPAPSEERIRVYGDVAVLTTLLKIGGRYSGRAHSGTYRALVVWVKRDGRWQQVANQLTAVAAP
jgi:ketosteroid isomerase-like protein